jgi:hypothetical protein
MFGWHAPHGKVTVLGQGPVTSRPRPVGPQVAARRLFVPCRPVGLTGHLFVARCVTQKTHTVRGEESRLAKQRKRPARPGATARTDRPLVGASPACTAVTRSTGSTIRTFRRCSGSSPSAARSARGGSRERAAAIRARSRVLSSARVSLRCCRTSPKARTSAGNAASAPAVARAETGSGQRSASCPGDWVLAG